MPPLLTIAEFGRAAARRARSPRARATDACLRADRAGQPAAERVHPGDGRRGAAARQRRPTASWRRDAIADRCTACRFRSRICSTSAARRPPPPRGCATGTSPAATRRRSRGCAQAGAVIIGKTNLHEFAFGTTNEDSAFGPARNPHDPSRSPGGSSGGSAASLVAGMALGTLGTDTGGSIRIPAAACGIVGLKPTYGELPTEGVVPLSRTLDHVGPLALTVGDARLMYHALRGHGPTGRRDSAAGTAAAGGAARATSATCWTIEVRERFEAALEALRQSGATVADVDIADAPLVAGGLPASLLRRRRGLSRRDARDDAGALYAAGAAAAGDGPVRPGGGLRPRARRPPGAATRGRSRCSPGTTRWCCRRCRFLRRSSAQSFGAAGRRQ